MAGAGPRATQLRRLLAFESSRAAAKDDVGAIVELAIKDNGWEVDLDGVESLADQNTVAMVIINPGNPCGNVYSYQHLKKKLQRNLEYILVIADEVYGHLAFGEKLFVPTGVFGSTVHVLTLGSLSKRWIGPGWRLGWFVTTDPCGTSRKHTIVERIKKYFDRLASSSVELNLLSTY